jgi:thymidylate kinase
VVSEVAYGQPVHALRTELARGCLAHRRRHGDVYIPGSEDELVTLLLHCVLDKGGFAPERWQRLVALRGEIADPRYLDKLLAANWSTEQPWPRLAALLERGDQQALLAERGAVARRLARRDFLGTLRRRVGGRVLRKLDRWAGLLRPRALAVALLAPDGAGKTTLANELTRTFYMPSRYIYMGMNLEASTVGLPTTRWLHAQGAPSGGAARLPLRALARGLRFPNTLIEQWYRAAVGYYSLVRGRLVIFDRFVYDTLLGSKERMSLKTRLRRRLLTLGAPKPDLVVLLDAPGEVLYARKGEHSPAVLEQQRQGYLRLLPHLPQMVVVDATRNTDEVRRQVTSLIWRGYASRLDRSAAGGRR